MKDQIILIKSWVPGKSQRKHEEKRDRNTHLISNRLTLLFSRPALLPKMLGAIKIFVLESVLALRIYESP